MAVPQIGSGLNHIAQYEGKTDVGWRLREGWELLELIAVQYNEDGTYHLLTHIRAEVGYEGPLMWPPFEDMNNE